VPGQPDVNKDGVARVFDAKPDAPTYLFVRGDDRNPDKSRVLTPGVPTLLGGEALVKPVTFSPSDFAKSLEPAAADALKKARAEVAATEAGVKAAGEAIAAAKRRLEQIADNPNAPPEPAPFLHDTFAARSDAWKPLSGKWEWEKGKLVQKAPGHFMTLVTTKNHPQSLMGRVRYRTTGGPIVGRLRPTSAATAAGGVHALQTDSAMSVSPSRWRSVPAAGIVPHPFHQRGVAWTPFAAC
jgi:hypothetical protein